MIAVKVHKISFHPPSRSYAVILKEIDGERRLPVIVGAFEAQSIALALEYMETPRPLTHDLIGNIIKGIESSLKTVKITSLKEGVFYARLEIEGDGIGVDIWAATVRVLDKAISKSYKDKYLCILSKITPESQTILLLSIYDKRILHECNL